MNENKNKPIPLVIATRNLDKIAEIERHLNGTAYTLRAISQFASASEVIEDGETIEANAIKKAQHAAAHTELMALADDTGLEVDFLNGAPGVFSSRFAGEGASYEDNTNND